MMLDGERSLKGYSLTRKGHSRLSANGMQRPEGCFDLMSCSQRNHVDPHSRSYRVDIPFDAHEGRADVFCTLIKFILSARVSLSIDTPIPIINLSFDPNHL